MTKQEIVEALHEKFGGELNKRQAEDAFEHLFDILTDAMIKGNPVRVAGFGTFKVVERAARKGHNPKTGDIIDIPAKKAVKFKPAAVLRDVVQ
ncbi:MAG: HU family DNA-binding protein [Planctomycetes bacterium]|nr:HU family DNA-binding protein [Planctomycetota bacterium]